MHTSWKRLLGFPAVLVVAMPALASDPLPQAECERLLPAAEVSKAVGATVHWSPRNPKKAAGGSCNWADGKDYLVLMASVYPDGGDGAWNGTKGALAKQTPLAGIGEAAFSSGETIVAARKGAFVCSLSGFGNALNVEKLTPLLKQMIAAAK